MYRTTKLLRLLLIADMIAIPRLLAAQSGFEDDVLDNPVPFDGGVSLLVLVAISYGLKKAYNKRKTDTF